VADGLTNPPSERVLTTSADERSDREVDAKRCNSIGLERPMSTAETKQPSPQGHTPGAPNATASREGVLAIPGQIQLHFGGALDSVSLAWRLVGPAGAPIVVALGGISARGLVA
jgi:hypothetical protein